MRVLILDANYPGFLDDVYSSDPAVRSAPYEEQRERIRQGLFGEVNFQIDALRELGHEADSIIVNASHAQQAWAREHGFIQRRARRVWRMGRRRGLPWLVSQPAGIDWDLVIAQVRDFRPDVVYVGILDTLPTDVLAEIKPLTSLVVAQIAASVPVHDFSGYDLVLSSIPTIVERFRTMGVTSELVPLAFEPSVLDTVTPRPRDVPVSFIGSLTPDHVNRVEVLEEVARLAPLHTWTVDRSAIGRRSPIRPTLRGSAFGRDMYTVLARSRITLNTHHSAAGPDANNLRLYEGTGMGCLLITDHRRNLDQLFKLGAEIVSYRTPNEAGELVRHYLSDSHEASRIAGAGQARTLRDHTWHDRMRRTVDIMEGRMR